MKNIRIYVFGILTLLCAIFILYNSSQDYEESNNRSYNIVDKINEEVSNKELDKYNIESIDEESENRKSITNEQINLLIRKLAHFIQYFIFSILMMLFLKEFNINNREKIIYSLFGVLLLATCDEFYQSFIDGRTSSVKDVIIDFLGGITGVVWSKVIDSTNSKLKHIIKNIQE